MTRRSTDLDRELLGEMGVRRFGRVNWLGLRTLIEREVRRFMAVWQQTIFAPLITAGLFIVVFVLALGRDRGEIMGMPYVAFLGPGILMMTVIQNAFANSSSSMISAKMQGNIVDTLMPPLSAGEILTGYLVGSLFRAGLVALVIASGLALTLGLVPARPLWAVAFVVLGALGLIAGVVAQKFDQMAVITNFVVAPLSFLSGTFYSVQRLPEFWQLAAHLNPFFYMIDGFRYGFIDHADGRVGAGLAVMAGINLLFGWVAYRLFRVGYKIKS